MVTAIACVDKNMGIGYKGKLLTHIPEDMKKFKELTINNIIVMGRKTWDSLDKKPLPNRFNMVISSNHEELNKKEDVSPFSDVIFCSMNYVKYYICNFGKTKNIFIIGGEKIYQELLDYCDKIMLTRVNKSFDKVDVYFPRINDDEWICCDYSNVNDEYYFAEFKRNEEATKNGCEMEKQPKTVAKTEKSLNDRQKLILLDLICNKQISMIQENSNAANNNEYLELEQIKITLKET